MPALSPVPHEYRAAVPPRGLGGYTISSEHLIAVFYIFFLISIARIGINFVPATNQIFWIIAYAWVAMAFARQPSLYLTLIRNNAVFFLGPLFATCSAFWSVMPGFTAFSGISIVLGVIVGFYFYERLGLKKIIILTFCFSLFIQILSPIVALMLREVNVAGGLETRGLYLHKNNFSMHANLLFLGGMVLFASGWYRPLAAIGIVVSLINVVFSGSSTGILMTFLITAVLGCCWAAVGNRRQSMLIFGMGIVSVSVIVAAIAIAGFDPVEFVLNELGKDSTLTGRTILWDAAIRSFNSRPWLGVGYAAFWNSDQTEAPSIWILTGQALVSFHNNYLDRLVDVGIIGLVLFMAGYIQVFYRSLRNFGKEQTAIAAWPVAYLSLVAGLCMSEYPIFWNTEFQLLLSVIAAAVAGVKVDGVNDRMRRS